MNRRSWRQMTRLVSEVISGTILIQLLSCWFISLRIWYGSPATLLVGRGHSWEWIILLGMPAWYPVFMVCLVFLWLVGYDAPSGEVMVAFIFFGAIIIGLRVAFPLIGRKKKLGSMK